MLSRERDRFPDSHRGGSINLKGIWEPWLPLESGIVRFARYTRRLVHPRDPHIMEKWDLVVGHEEAVNRTTAVDT